MKKKARVTPPNESSDKRLNWDVFVKVAAVVVSAATLGFGVYQYVVKPRQEARADVYNRKKELYNQAMDSTSRFAIAPGKLRCVCDGSPGMWRAGSC